MKTRFLIPILAASTIAVAGHAQMSIPANPDPAAVQAGNYAVETSHTRVQFSVSHMGFSDWYGDFAGVTGTLSLDPAHTGDSKVDIVIPVASVTTTSAKLDGELKGVDWLDAVKYPTIRFTSVHVMPTGTNKATIHGNLTLHGVTKPVALEATFNGSGINPMSKAVTVGFNATTRIKRSDFGVSAYVPLIGDEIDIRISAAFEKTAS